MLDFPDQLYIVTIYRMHVTIAPLSLFLALLLLSLEAAGSPIALPSSVETSHPGLGVISRAASEECAFDGNPDFYGLGIRIAIYLQWVTAFVANHLLGEEAVKGYLENNTIFLVAVFAALAIATADQDIRSAEIVVHKISPSFSSSN